MAMAEPNLHGQGRGRSTPGAARLKIQAACRAARERKACPPDIAARLLNWYDHHKRDLPWRRREQDAYAQLVAEMMLQQTQVVTVVPYYERFMERFPNIQALAWASIDELLPLWAGLGYYSRIRNLHAAARRIVNEYGGCVPDSVEGLMLLPGVGRYTAGAIASIAYGVRAAVLDGNVGRVLMRLVGLEADPKAPATRAELWRLAEAVLPEKRCGDFNQAVMELGATVCSPHNPDCLLCPLNATCRACRDGSTDRIPRPAPRARVTLAAMAVAAICRGSEMLFVQRPMKGLWGGLWELPSEPVENGGSLAVARRRLRRKLPAGVRLSTAPVETIVRRLTHREMTFHVFQGSNGRTIEQERGSKALSSSANLSCGLQPWKWLPPSEAPRLGISRACESILNKISLHPERRVVETKRPRRR